MSSKPLSLRLCGGIRNPRNGETIPVPTPSVVVEETLEGGEADLVHELSLGRTLAVVSDVDTEAALGGRVMRALGARGTGLSATSVVLPSHPHADEETVEFVRRSTRGAEGLVAVGSGTINDLCKYAAALDGRRYAVFGTAPSMNGYTSVNASITVGGLKKTLPAVAASGVFLDLGVLAAAPLRLIRAGLGDSLCRSTVQADWLLAHLLRGDRYDDLPFQLLAEDEEGLFAGAGRLVQGDLPAMARLVRTLLISGFNMTLCGGSQPASQGEHLISHFAEMFAPPGQPEALHGEMVGVATLTMAGIQEAFLAEREPRVSASPETEEDFRVRYGDGLGAECWREFLAKRVDESGAARLNGRLAEGWGEIRDRIAAVLRPRAFLEDVLRRAGAARAPEDLGWPREFYLQAVRRSREIRNRYTFLDLAADCGLLERISNADSIDRSR